MPRSTNWRGKKKKPKSKEDEADNLEVTPMAKVKDKVMDTFKYSFQDKDKEKSKDKVKDEPNEKAKDKPKEKEKEKRNGKGKGKEKDKSKEMDKSKGKKKNKSKEKDRPKNKLKDESNGKFRDEDESKSKDKSKNKSKDKSKGKSRDESKEEFKNESKDKSKDKRPTTPGWRNAFMSGRPKTPAISIFHSNEASSEVAFDANSPSRFSRPSLGRIFSGLHPNPKAHLDHIDFSQPWWKETENELFPEPAPLDPHIALQNAFSHMIKVPSSPLPVSHFSGMFSLFEEYKKLRLAKEGLTDKFTKLVEEKEEAQYEWNEAEVQYQSEIRRLELHIAHGTTGMEGLAKARMGSVIRRHRVIGVSKRNSRAKATVPVKEKIDRHREGSERLRRVSSSDRMTTMSQRFPVNDVNPMHIGTPPTHDAAPLTRKLKSELNMAKMMTAAAPASSVGSEESGFTESGDLLPDEIEAVKDFVDNVDAFPVLRELAGVVAQQRGLDQERFTSGLMQLLMEKLVNNTVGIPEDTDTSSSEDENEVDGSLQLRSTPKRGRRFSWELGDDAPSALLLRKSSRNSSQELSAEKASYNVGGETPSMNADAYKPFDMVSPLQQTAYVSLRYSGSPSALSMAERRHSGSSVVTAFRNNSPDNEFLASLGSDHATGSAAYRRSKSEHEFPC